MQNYTKDQLGNSFRDEIFVGLDVDKASISVIEGFGYLHRCFDVAQHATFVLD